MNELNDTDWQSVNAYHDGALSAKEAREFEARLQAEPTLRSALADVSEVNNALSQLRPELAQTKPAANRNRRPWYWLAGTAAAAAIAVVVYLAPLGSGQNLERLHSEFAAQQYIVSAEAFRPASAQNTGNFPDLSQANLKLVDTRVFDGGQAAHYAGVNGCRLTFVDGDISVPTLGSNGEEIAIWSINDDSYAVISTGMDQNRFSAIVIYLRQETRLNALAHYELAMQEATENAAPCGVT